MCSLLTDPRARRKVSAAFGFALALVLCACGPQIGNLEKGEIGRVARVLDGDTLELDSGLRVFLAEIDAPRGDDAHAAQANGELEALALHRRVQLAYGGTRRWSPRQREGQEQATPETAIAHVYVQSEGGRWFWLQHALVDKGAAFVRPRRDNHARAEELLRIEARARAEERGLWNKREWRTLNARAAAEAALAADVNCLRSAAPFRIVEGVVATTHATEGRAEFTLAGGPEQTPFSLVAFGAGFANWNGPAPASLTGARIRARGPLGVFRGAPQLCLEDGRDLEVLTVQSR